jgi:hypothetical protein
VTNTLPAFKAFSFGFALDGLRRCKRYEYCLLPAMTYREQIVILKDRCKEKSRILDKAMTSTSCNSNEHIAIANAELTAAKNALGQYEEIMVKKSIRINYPFRA